MNYVRFFSGIARGDSTDQSDLAGRIEAASIHFQPDPAKALSFQKRTVGAWRRQHDDVQAMPAQILCKRQAKVIEVPVRVREEENLHSILPCSGRISPGSF